MGAQVGAEWHSGPKMAVRHPFYRKRLYADGDRIMPEGPSEGSQVPILHADRSAGACPLLLVSRVAEGIGGMTVRSRDARSRRGRPRFEEG